MRTIKDTETEKWRAAAPRLIEDRPATDRDKSTNPPTLIGSVRKCQSQLACMIVYSHHLKSEQTLNLVALIDNF